MKRSSQAGFPNRIVLLTACLLVVGAVAHAQNTAWTNTAGGNWSVAGNWNPSVPPGPGTNVFLTNNTGAASYIVTNDILDNTFANLTIFNPAGAGLHTLWTSVDGLYVTGDLILGRNGILVVSNAFASVGGSVTLSNAAVLRIATNSVLHVGGTNQTLANASAGVVTNLAGGIIELGRGGAASFYGAGVLNASTTSVGVVNQGTIRTFQGAHYVSGVVNAVVFNETNGVITTSTLINHLVLAGISTNRGTITVGNITAAIFINGGNVVNEGTIRGTTAGGTFWIKEGALINNSDVFINGPGHSFVAQSTLNNGRIIVTNSQQSGEAATFGGPFTNNGLVQLHQTLSPFSFNYNNGSIRASNFINNGTIESVGRYGTLLTNMIPATVFSSPITNQAGGTIISSNGSALINLTHPIANLNGATLRVESNSFLAIGATMARMSNMVAGTSSYRNEGIIELKGGAFGTSVLSNAAGASLQGYGDVGQITLTNLAPGNFAQYLATRPVVNAGLIAPNGVLNAGDITNLAGGQIIGQGTIQSLNYTNSELGGLVSVNTGARIHNAAGASIFASGGPLILGNGLLADSNPGTLGATNNGTLQLGDGTFALTNTGTIRLTGGSLVSGNLQNDGAIRFEQTGNGLLVGGTLTIGSGGILTATNAVGSVAGAVNSLGTILVVDSHLTFSNAVSIGGLYYSDPSTNTFVGDVTVTPAGVLVGGAGDLFDFQKSLFIQSTNATVFDLGNSEVRFSGGGIHTNAVTGGDVGADFGGLANNFSYGRLTVGSASDVIEFVSGGFTNGGASAHALYVQEVALWNGLVLDTNLVANLVSPFNIYYLPLANAPFNSYLNDLTYPLLGGGFLMPMVPEPSVATLLLLGGALGAWRKRSR